MSDEYELTQDDIDAPNFDGYGDGFDNTVDEESALKSTEELASRVRRLVELRITRDNTKAAADRAKKEFEDYQRDFFDEYEKSPLEGSIKLNLGGEHGTVQITPRRTHYGRILDRDKAVAYFRERGQMKEFTKDDFRMARLHELVREFQEQKKPLPPGIDFYTKEAFTMTFKD